MQISLAHPTELSATDTRVWRALQRQTDSLINPFLCPEFSLAVSEFQPNARVAVLSDGSEIVGFFPFERRRFGIGRPIGSTLNNCQGLIYAPGVEWDPRQLLNACKLTTWKFDNLPQGQKPFEGYATDRFSTAVIDLTDGFDAYFKGLQLRSSRSLKDLKRKRARLEKDFGDVRCVADSHDVNDLAAIISWKSDQCRRNGWVNIFDRPWVMNLIRRLFEIKDDSFSSMLSMTYAADMPIAGVFELRSRHFLSGWLAAYNPEFAKYSPGFISHVEAAEQFAAVGVEIYDTGGAAPYQEKLKSGDIYFTQGTVATGPLAARIDRARASAVGWAQDKVRDFPPAYRAADNMLRRLGRIA